MGKAMMGTGEAEGEDRAMRAADMAISNPLLDDVSMKGARGVLINITGGPDLMLFEVEQAANRIRAEVDPDANIIFGNTILDDMEGRIRVSVVATGIDVEHQIQKVPERMAARPAIKPLPARPEPPPRVEARPAPIANPVHRQVDALAEELGAARHAPVAPQPAAPMPQPVAARAPMSEIEHQIFDEDQDTRSLDEKYPVTVTIRPIPTRVQPAPEPSNRLFGFLGRKKKEEPRMEPVQMQRPQPQHVRASAQVIARQPGPEQVRQQPQQAQPQDDDLFPDHKRDEQFEIPAFLRRQTN
jgi:cell division protein FtsZ